MLAIQGLGKALATIVLVATSAFATGCAIHTQAPVKEVPYDFSDAAFYDRAYATSPAYETADHDYRAIEAQGYMAPAAVDADAEGFIAPAAANAEADEAGVEIEELSQ